MAERDGMDSPAAEAAADPTGLQGDYVIRAVADEGRILAFAARTSRVCDEARRRQDLWPTAVAATGRVLTATALLALPQKEGSLTVRVAGDGPIRGIIAAGTPDGDVRGYALNPHVDLPPRPDGKFDVGGAVGRHGVLRVTRDLGMRHPYTGSSPLVTGEIGEDFASYFARSEQVPSLVGLGVLVGRGGRVRAAGGLIVQLLPGAPAAAAGRIDANVGDIGAISRVLDAGGSPEGIVEAALAGFSPRVLERRAVRFRCRCGRRRLAAVLRSLPTEEIRTMRLEDGGAELVCHFCGRKYQFSAEDLLEIETGGAPASK